MSSIHNCATGQAQRDKVIGLIKQLRDRQSIFDSMLETPSFPKVNNANTHWLTWTKSNSHVKEKASILTGFVIIYMIEYFRTRWD